MSGFSVVRPIQITDAMIVSSTAPETEYAAYVATTDYAVGERSIYSHKIWESVQTPNVGHTPGTDALYWADKGATNQRAMFDALVSTQTVIASPLTTVIKPGYANSLTLFGLGGSDIQVTARNGLAGPIVYDRAVSLDGSIITSLYEYFYEPFVQLSSVVLTDLPTYGDIHITVALTGPGDVKCGFLSAGTNYEIGDAQFGATVEIIDYSRKDTSASGVTTLMVGEFSKRLSAEVLVDNLRFNKVMRVLESLRATPCAWITTDVLGLEPLTVFGFYRGAPLTVDNFTNSRCNIDIEGLV